MYPHTDAGFTADVARIHRQEWARDAEARRAARQVARAAHQARTDASATTPIAAVAARAIWRLLTRRHATV